MSDNDIEFLDEDADIVQQCVQLQPIIKVEPAEEKPSVHLIQKLNLEAETGLLIERPPLVTERSVPVKKRKKDEDDTDYDPIVDSPYFNRKRRYNASKSSNVRKHETGSRNIQQSQISQSSPLRKAAISRTQTNRRDMIIRIPDFDDPLCLPVRALVKDENDARRLKHWNQLCLDQFKNNDTPLLPRNGPVTSSKRTVVIRNLFNKYSGKTETTFWSKITVQGMAGDTKSDVMQSVLPRYREKKILTAYRLAEVKRRRTFRERSEVILTKEKYRDEDMLIAYKPESSLSMVFKMFESESGGAAEGAEAREEDKRYLQEVASCTACARCYQTSWRGVFPAEKRVTASSSVACAVCSRACVSPAALLKHLKTHAADDVRAHRRDISDTLAQLLPHQFRCRVCQQQFAATRELRRHLSVHKGVGEMYCEVGDHSVY